MGKTGKCLKLEDDSDGKLLIWRMVKLENG